MFPPSDTPRIFGLPPGVDFATAVVDGIAQRLKGAPPESWARTTIFVNTRRMQRRIRSVFAHGPARLLPRVRMITDLALDPAATHLPPPAAPLRRRLELSQLIAKLLEQQPDLAPRAALYDLADSLAALIDEMQGEGVAPDVINALNVTDQSGHWARSLEFIKIIQTYFDPNNAAPDREARQREIITDLAQRWAVTPPQDPVLIAGSTGSRGATALLMQAISHLPQGAIILPGFDFDMPQDVWDQLGDPMTAEDHPQARFRNLLFSHGITAADVLPWHGSAPASPKRNALISLAMRPAPVTDQWRRDGPNLGDLREAVADLTMVDAPSPRIEAEAIALRLRQAVDDGVTAALITPDRMLTRQVTAALDRWNITPDDSAGLPLHLSPPGRLLRHSAACIGQTLTAEALLTLLKHPLCNAGDARGQHILRTHELELHLRRYGPPFPSRQSLIAWAGKTGEQDVGRMAWATWIADALDPILGIGDQPLSTTLAQHIAATEQLAAGPNEAGSGTLWDKAEGRTAKRVIDDLLLHADAGGDVAPWDYLALIDTLLRGGEVRDRDRGHPGILIWGTLEARVQTADLVILAGLNEGTWPEAASPDPWLNRALRAQAGLLLPERRIGLAAHDFIQAIAGPKVWITRSIRSEDTETVPSRWINRLTNLLEGLPDQHGPDALTAMKSRGQRWIETAQQLSDAPSVTPAARPSPRPPLAARPKALSVTGITRLVRDPYSIYADKVLGLRQLDPLSPTADAPLRGTVLHKVFERFIKTCPDPSAPEAKDQLLSVAKDILEDHCPWPTNRHLWFARIAENADWFLSTEIERRSVAAPDDHFEVRGSAALTGLDFTLTCIADRIDLTPDGRAVIYDYKTGKPPSEKEQKTFEKQLLLEAAILEQGGFENLGPRAVQSATYIGLGTQPSEQPAPLSDQPPDQVWSDLHELIQAWQNPQRGYTSRLSPKFIKYDGDFDHLARFGEWDQSTDVTPEDIS